MLCLAMPGWAHGLESRTDTNLPVGQNFAGIGYVYSNGEINPAPGVPIEDTKLTVKRVATAYMRLLDLWGRAGKLDVGHLIYHFGCGRWLSLNGNDYDTFGLAWQHRWAD